MICCGAVIHDNNINILNHIYEPNSLVNLASQDMGLLPERWTLGKDMDGKL